MKSSTYLLLTLLAMALNTASAQTWQRPCQTNYDWEISITVEEISYSGVSVKVWDALDEDAESPIFDDDLGSLNSVRPVVPYPGYSGCHWAAVLDGGTGADSIRTLDADVLYRFEIYENDVLKANFTYGMCIDEPYDDFMCGAMSGGFEDLYVIYRGSGDYGVKIDQFFETGENDWLLESGDGEIYPYDIDYFCDRIGEDDNDDCMSAPLDDFITDQVFSFDQTTGQPIMSHMSDDLIVPAGNWGAASWNVDGSTSEGNVILQMQSGTSFVVEGNASLREMTLETGTGYFPVWVEEDGALTLGDDTVIEVGYYGWIVADGTLTLDGSEGAPVSLVPASTWGGILIGGSGADGSSFDNVYIQGPAWGVAADNIDQFDITDSVIESTNDYSIILDNTSNSSVSGTTVDGSVTASGISISDGSASLFADSIRNSDCCHGLVIASATVELMGPNDTPGKNVITGNDGYGIRVYGGSTVDMGHNSQGEHGENSVTGNGGYDIHVSGSSAVTAYQNWWGEDPPDTGDFYVEGGSTFNYDPYLDSPPSKGGLRSEDHHSYAFSDDSEFIRYVNELRNNGGRRESARYLAEIVHERGHPQRPIAIPYYVRDLAHTGDDVTAVSEGEEFLAESALPEAVRAKVARALFSLYRRSVKSVTGASRMRDAIHQFGDSDVEKDLVDNLLNRFAASVGGAVAFGKRRTEVVAPDYVLSVYAYAYPNPFSNSTTIEFTLDEPRDMSVTVYDVLGREVQRLVEEWLPEGQYHFRFTPDDYLAQGLYFYRLQSGEKYKAGKLIYVK